MIRLVLFLLLTTISSLAFSQNQDEIAKIGLFTYGGLPTVDGTGTEIKTLYNTAYISGYSEELRVPLWVVYRLGNMKETTYEFTNWERPRRFAVDYRTTSRVDHDAYNGTGYDRGHMAPNSAILSQYGQMAQLETYLMTNIIPQTEALNQGIWMQLEGKVRTELSQFDDPDNGITDVFVITGPIFDTDPPARLPEQNVAIPTHSYKILAYRRGYFGTIKAVAFIIPQSPTSENFFDYVVTVDEVEERTGLNFFSELSTTKQHNLESRKRDFELNDL
jgi:endonuclease G